MLDIFPEPRETLQTSLSIFGMGTAWLCISRLALWFTSEGDRFNASVELVKKLPWTREGDLDEAKQTYGPGTRFMAIYRGLWKYVGQPGGVLMLATGTIGFAIAALKRLME